MKCKVFHLREPGVALSKITPLPIVQLDLFGEVLLTEHYSQAHLMAVVDAINRIFGRETLFFAVQGMVRDWRTRQNMLSQRFTTGWDELMLVT